MTEKTCFKCKRELPIDCFYKHLQMADGHLNKCKECTKTDTIQNRLKNVNYYRSYDKARGSRQCCDYVAKYRKLNPEKYRATSMVNRMVRNGQLLKQNCEVCGAKQTHAHHEDYSRPLDVRWLCPPCHAERHKTIKKQKQESK